jgi:hypothetical protein
MQGGKNGMNVGLQPLECGCGVIIFEITLHQTLRWNERCERMVGLVNCACHCALTIMKSREVHGKTIWNTNEL